VDGSVYDVTEAALISDGPQFIVAARSVPAKEDIKELIAWLGARNRSVRSPDWLVFGSVWVPRPRLLRRDATQRPTFARPRSCQLAAARTATMADLVRSGRGGVPLLVAIYLGLR
jgi:hypothetical protein